jgi:predicted metal-binding membrane protein
MLLMQRPSARSVGGPLLLPAIALLVVAAWAALWMWERSPEARFLHHAGGTGAPAIVETALFVTGWAVMTVAMMLPTTVPLVRLFRALVSRRPHPARLVVLLLGGYLVTWIAFGALVYLGDRVIHLVVDATPWLAAHPQLITGSVLLAAGGYQFSPLKYRCLDECRSPLGFLMNRWRARREHLESFSIGVAHGLFCVGCCWSLMLVMFALGLGNLAWMFALGVLMTIEKNASIGRRLGRPVGAALVFAGLLTLAG